MPVHNIQNNNGDVVRSIIEDSFGTVGADIEIVGRGSTRDNDSMIVPDDFRINGQSLYIDGDDPVIVHEIRPHEPVRVTVTLIAKSVSIRNESKGGE